MPKLEESEREKKAVPTTPATANFRNGVGAFHIPSQYSSDSEPLKDSKRTHKFAQKVESSLDKYLEKEGDFPSLFPNSTPILPSSSHQEPQNMHQNTQSHNPTTPFPASNNHGNAPMFEQPSAHPLDAHVHPNTESPSHTHPPPPTGRPQALSIADSLKAAAAAGHSPPRGCSRRESKGGESMHVTHVNLEEGNRQRDTNESDEESGGYMKSKTQAEQTEAEVEASGVGEKNVYIWLACASTNLIRENSSRAFVALFLFCVQTLGPAMIIWCVHTQRTHTTRAHTHSHTQPTHNEKTGQPKEGKGTNKCQTKHVSIHIDTFLFMHTYTPASSLYTYMRINASVLHSKIQTHCKKVTCVTVQKTHTHPIPPSLPC
eukprot:GDKI01000212.1.p1 GENE.GDKI01000212.1~~GDKI01000212.1.p1  ORF type:complete len:374 (-),score=55.88 GDKI01000212.1:24-1145(-)